MVKIYKKVVPGHHNRFTAGKLRSMLPKILIVTGIMLTVLSLGPIIYSEIWYNLKQAKQQEMVLNLPEVTGINTGGLVRDSVFARLLGTQPILVEPVNKEFSVVIEKIGVNAPIVENVSISDADAYKSALKEGIAHAINSSKPSEKAGNVYLFAHASLNFWELGKYATTFNLLRKMSPGDPIYIFYKGKTFVYKVVNLEKYEGWNTYPITRPVIEPILTLQTCDPPGTTLNRLVLTAKLDKVYSTE